jgi:hypothetical protein
MLDIYRRGLQVLPRAGTFFKNITVNTMDALYEQGSGFLSRWVERLRSVQNGNLAKYLVWFYVGIIIIMEVIRR